MSNHETTRRMRPAAVWVLLALLCALCAGTAFARPQAAQAATSYARTIRDGRAAAQALLDQSGAASLSLALVSGDRVVWRRGLRLRGQGHVPRPPRAGDHVRHRLGEQDPRHGGDDEARRSRQSRVGRTARALTHPRSRWLSPPTRRSPCACPWTIPRASGLDLRRRGHGRRTSRLPAADDGRSGASAAQDDARLHVRVL